MSRVKVVFRFRLHEVRWSVPDLDLARLRADFSPVEFVPADDERDLPAALADADVFCGWIFPEPLFARAARLRWFHSASAGIEANLFPALVRSDVALTSSSGLHAVSIPEHALALMLALARNVHIALRLQQQHRFDRLHAISAGVGVQELSGRNLAILGAGTIGAALAPRARALGMRVRVLRRRPGLAVEGAEEVVGPDGLLALLGWADFVVVATPLTAETRGMIGREALAAMKPTAHLVNVGRGELIDDDALVAALRAGGIGGAGLDVFREEPLPPGSPYWELENAIVTPHVSGYTPGYFDKVMALFADNLRRFLAGAPLHNLIDKRLGYAPNP